MHRTDTLSACDGYRTVFFTSVVLCSALLAGCENGLLPKRCEDTDRACLVEHALQAIVEVRGDINFWSFISVSMQVVIIFSGILSAIMIALQEDKNKGWTKPVALVAATLSTGLTSALVSLHIPENIDKLIQVAGHMTKVTNEFDQSFIRLAKGKSQKEVDELFEKDEVFRDAVNCLTTKFANEFSVLRMDVLKIKGSSFVLKSDKNQGQGN